MTKTYNDIDAVTRLLEEKERDLELAARIGQTLLSKNKELSSRTEALEEQVGLANDRVSQLRHDLGLKDELLRIYNEDLELHQPGHPTPIESQEGVPGINIDFLQKKVHTLEEENLNLRLESAQLKVDTDSYEEKEKKLVDDCIHQLAEVNQQVESLAEELHNKVEENGHLKEEVTQYLSQVTDMQKRIRKLTLDNMDMQEKLTASTESQRKLTKELGSMQDKYDELFEMLEEAQDELRITRSKHRVKATGQHHHSAYGIPTDSLASELETSLQQELSQSTRRAQSWKIFETAKAAKRAAAKAERERTSSLHMSVTTAASSFNDTASLSTSFSACPSDGESLASDGYNGDLDSLYSSNPELGRPGIPGSNDLESALRRLAMRRANELNEKDFQEEEEERRRRRQLQSISGANSPATTSSPLPATTPSTPTPMSAPNTPGRMWDRRLQIVKPLEGSVTLRHWQHLATPHLGGIFEPREGVQMKGERRLDLVTEEQVYSLSDFEEDGAAAFKLSLPDDLQDIHTRREEDSSGLVYTWTDSTVASLAVPQYRGLGCLFDSPPPRSSSTNYQATSTTTTGSTDTTTAATAFPGPEDRPKHTSSPIPHPHPHLRESSSISSAGVTPLSVKQQQYQPRVIGPMQHSAMQGPRTPPPSSSSSSTATADTQSTYTMSLGLAALLQSRDNNPSAGIGQVLMRRAAVTYGGSQPNIARLTQDSGPPGGPPSGGRTHLSTASSSSSLLAAVSNEAATSSPSSSFMWSFPDSSSPRLFASHSMSHLPEEEGHQGSSTPSLSATMLKSLPGSRSFQEALEEHQREKGATAGGASVRRDLLAGTTKDKEGSNLFPPGMTGQGFLQQLKNKGLSLYGLWGGGGSGDEGSKVTNPSTTSELGGGHQPIIKSGSPSTTDDLSAPQEEPSGSEVVFDNSGGAGVLGALTNFRRNNIF